MAAAKVAIYCAFKRPLKMIEHQTERQSSSSPPADRSQQALLDTTPVSDTPACGSQPMACAQGLSAVAQDVEAIGLCIRQMTQL